MSLIILNFYDLITFMVYETFNCYFNIWICTKNFTFLESNKIFNIDLILLKNINKIIITKNLLLDKLTKNFI